MMCKNTGKACAEETSFEAVYPGVSRGPLRHNFKTPRDQPLCLLSIPSTYCTSSDGEDDNFRDGSLFSFLFTIIAFYDFSSAAKPECWASDDDNYSISLVPWLM